MNRFAGAAGREVLLDAMDTIVDLINDSDALEDWNNNVFVVTVLNNKEFADACDCFEDIISNYTRGRYDFSCPKKDEEKAIKAFETVAETREYWKFFKEETEKIKARDELAFRTDQPDVDVFSEYCDIFVKVMDGWYRSEMFEGYRKRKISRISKINWDIQLYDCLEKIRKCSDAKAADFLDVTESEMKDLRKDERMLMQKVYEKYTLGPVWKAILMGVLYELSSVPKELEFGSTKAVFQYLEEKYNRSILNFSPEMIWVYEKN